MSYGLTENRVAVSVVVSLALVLASLYYLFRADEERPKELPTEGGLGLSKEEREMFIPTPNWKRVEDHHICPAGLEYRLNMTDGSKLARIPPESYLPKSGHS